MKMYIHSSYGVLECTPMTLQAIEKSIPEGQVSEITEFTGSESDKAEACEVSPELATEQTTVDNP